MKSLPFSLFVIITLFITLAAPSCHKEDPEPDLVPITTTGANTMGFYVDGVPHNKKGQSTWSNVYGVRGGISAENILYISGGGGDPKISLTIYLEVDRYNPEKEYILNGLDFYKNRISIIDNSSLGGKQFVCDSFHTGKLTLHRLEDNMAAGTFYFDAINPETGKVIKVTDGRFDIQFF